MLSVLPSVSRQAVFRPIDDAVLTKRMQPGFAGRGGVMAALLAQRGITGAKNIFEGDFGVFHVYQRDQYDAHALSLTR